MNDCYYCDYSIVKKLKQKILFTKYFDEFNFYFAKPINEILANLSIPHIVQFKDYLYYDDFNEYLKRYYNDDEIPPRVQILTEFYQNNYKQTNPNLNGVDQHKVIQKRLHKQMKLYFKNNQDGDEDNKQEEIFTKPVLPQSSFVTQTQKSSFNYKYQNKEQYIPERNDISMESSEYDIYGNSNNITEVERIIQEKKQIKNFKLEEKYFFDQDTLGNICYSDVKNDFQSHRNSIVDVKNDILSLIQKRDCKEKQDQDNINMINDKQKDLYQNIKNLQIMSNDKDILSSQQQQLQQQLQNQKQQQVQVQQYIINCQIPNSQQQQQVRLPSQINNKTQKQRTLNNSQENKTTSQDKKIQLYKQIQKQIQNQKNMAKKKVKKSNKKFNILTDRHCSKQLVIEKGEIFERSCSNVKKSYSTRGVQPNLEIFKKNNTNKSKNKIFNSQFINNLNNGSIRKSQDIWDTLKNVQKFKSPDKNLTTNFEIQKRTSSMLEPFKQSTKNFQKINKKNFQKNKESYLNHNFKQFNQQNTVTTNDKERSTEKQNDKKKKVLTFQQQQQLIQQQQQLQDKKQYSIQYSPNTKIQKKRDFKVPKQQPKSQMAYYYTSKDNEQQLSANILSSRSNAPNIIKKITKKVKENSQKLKKDKINLKFKSIDKNMTKDVIKKMTNSSNFMKNKKQKL